jgi:hypothetical protein
MGTENITAAPRQHTEGGGKMGDQVNSLSEESDFMPTTNSKLRDK